MSRVKRWANRDIGTGHWTHVNWANADSWRRAEASERRQDVRLEIGAIARALGEHPDPRGRGPATPSPDGRPLALLVAAEMAVARHYGG